jgi:hypothetical protein
MPAYSHSIKINFLVSIKNHVFFQNTLDNKKKNDYNAFSNKLLINY